MALAQDLYDLYLVDKQLRGMQRRLNSSDKRVQTQTSHLDQLACQRDELTTQMKVAKAKTADLEGQSKAIEQRCTDLRARMNAVTNNKEYSALLIEVNTHKLEIDKLDDSTLEELARLEMFEKQKAELEAKIVDQEKLVNVVQAELKTRYAEIGDQVETFSRNREIAISKIPDETLATFNRLAEHGDEDPLAKVIESDRRNMDYTCGGCYMNLPVEHINTLLIRPDDVVCCPRCSRILYLEQELKASIGAKA